MAHVSLFIGGIRPLPESGRPTGMYKQPAGGPLELGREGFIGDEQADRRVHGGPEKAVHLYPARHYAKLAERFPEAAPQLVIGSLGENISTAELDENDVRIGDIWRLGSAELQVCQPRNPCWKIDERFASDGMAAFIAEHRLTGWYWRVVKPGLVAPGDTLELLQAAEGSFTLAEAMQCWQAHRPTLADLEKLAASPGIAKNWQQKIVSRVEWLRKNPEKTSPMPVAFHVKPENQ
ncbi:MOSC domain-containing protein [Ferribacterium limneticum]|uniref:MOSC domain-containing protein n=1 Tax=Ferribacterium limneticum TaxID=76259 RepID=UPI001CFB55FA|nr:MOSC domain-containing protein [Ferribacterium limneticum]UCV19048.1 MOSC domain-containing protein [Ferribacterium limneticum]